jgi:hypothetical protein
MAASRFSTECFEGPFIAPEEADLGGIAIRARD